MLSMFENVILNSIQLIIILQRDRDIDKSRERERGKIDE